VAESFFHSLKVGLIHGKTYNTRQETKTAIFEHIKGFTIGNASIPISATSAPMNMRKRM
jgi:hypothetical protein